MRTFLAVIAVVLTVIAAAELHAVVFDSVQKRALAAGLSQSTADATASKAERRAKYVADGAAHAALLAAVLFFAQRVVRGWLLLWLACAAIYGMIHGIFQAACGYAAYFSGGGLLAPPGGLCERTSGWEPIVLAVAFGVTLTVIAGRRVDT